MEDGERSVNLRRSILLTTSIFFIAQCTIFLLFAVSAGFASKYWSIFLPISGGFHIIVLILLLLFQDDFTIESTGEKLDHINLANIITLSRVSTMPTLLVLVMAAKEYNLTFAVSVLKKCCNILCHEE